MVITKEMMIRDLSERCNFWQKDVRTLFQGLDELVGEYLGKVTDDEDVVLNLVQGIKITTKVVPERERRNPKTGETVVCMPTIKPTAKFSFTLRQAIQNAYDNRKSGKKKV